MAFVMKGIKPKTMNEAVMRKMLLDEMRDSADEMLKDFHATTSTWDHKPEFEKLFQLSGGTVAIIVGTDDEIYGYVSNGTKRHWVGPKGKGRGGADALKFMSIYTPKTSPGSMSAGPGGGSGEFWFSKGHYVSGIKARRFDEHIQKLWVKKFKTRIEKAMSRARKASGYSI